MKFEVCCLIVFLFCIGAHGRGRVRRDCACGEANIKNVGRIVNGKTTSKNKYPWMAAMFLDTTFMCGGAIISDRNILTAGHCYYYIPNPLQSYWVLGMHDQQYRDGRHYNIVDYAMHPYFRNFTIYDDYDMTIVATKEKIVFNYAVSPICFNQPRDQYVGMRAIVAGWGRLNDTTEIMGTQLQETKVRVKPPDQCIVEVARLVRFNTKSMICAHEKGTDSCNGDSGGPLFLETHPNRYEMIAVVSFGDGCARNFPGIYSKTSDPVTQKWIKEYIVMSNADICRDPAGKITDEFFDDAFEEFYS